MTQSRVWLLAPAFIAVAGVSAQETAPQVPSRSDCGQTLVIPDAVLDSCDIYHVMSGEDGQLVATSDAAMKRVVATCNRIVGFIGVPFEFKAGQKMLAAGAFRVPVASLTTGNSDQDDQLRGAMLLNGAQHAELTFLITDCTPAEQTGTDQEFVSYCFTVKGRVTILGVSKDIECPVTATHMPVNFKRTFLRYPGEMVSLRTRFELKPADFGWKRPPFMTKDLLADTIAVDVALFLNEIPPTQTLDPEFPARERTAELQFLTLLRDFNEPDKAYAFAREQLKTQPESALLHNRFAFSIAAEPGIRKRNLDLALEAATRANALTQEKKAGYLDTLARVHYERGDLKSALATSRKAVANLAGVDPMTAGGIQQSLAKYEGEAKAAGLADAASAPVGANKPTESKADSTTATSGKASGG
ncbi:MAG: YceI family protein [Phycisphaerales bacterium]|nr:YceI family protein [Phycisphaerales bacterium]